MESETDWGHKKAKHILQRDRRYLGMSRYRYIMERVSSRDQWKFKSTEHITQQ